MICKFTNKTPEPQQINLIGGSVIVVGVSEIKEIDKDLVYLEEIERLKRFFVIEEFSVCVPEEKKRRVKKFQEVIDVPEDLEITSDGGEE